MIDKIRQSQSGSLTSYDYEYDYEFKYEFTQVWLWTELEDMQSCYQLIKSITKFEKETRHHLL